MRICSMAGEESERGPTKTAFIVETFLAYRATGADPLKLVRGAAATVSC